MNKGIHQICTMALLTGFLLGIHDGRVALWQDDDPQPIQVYDIPERTLPVADRLKLKEGIRVESREELWMLLENFF